jgi:hypothetical protein
MSAEYIFLNIGRNVIMSVKYLFKASENENWKRASRFDRDKKMG